MKKKNCVIKERCWDKYKFSVVIQTYNHIVKELEVFPEMTICELKLLMEKNFMIKKEYQELLYLVIN